MTPTSEITRKLSKTIKTLGSYESVDSAGHPCPVSTIICVSYALVL